jgi:hypothetical protein
MEGQGATMNRRNFLARLAAIPLVGVAVKAVASPVPKQKTAEQYLAEAKLFDERRGILPGDLVYFDANGGAQLCSANSPIPVAISLEHGNAGECVRVGIVQYIHS